MKVSKNWLGEYLDLKNISDKELFDLINAHVCEIETYRKMVDATNLIVGEVLECEMHPDSDHLHVCQVNVGNEVLQIVCGAPNVKKGVKVIVALVDAVLPGDFKIKKSKIRGVESFGMLCSLQELGIEEKYVPEEFKAGIYLFDDEVKAGDDPLAILGYDDTIIDLELTSNRSDLLSIEGVAYDLGAALNQKILPILPDFEEVSDKNPVSVEVTTDKCYKYLTRYVANVKIMESPQWLKARLIASGIRPINNVVDVTNFVLMELGQPLHSFDADKLGNKIVVRLANDGEKLVTLDDIERTLTKDDIVITNGTEVLCLGGVMGGKSTEVEADTKNILLEAAYFEPMSIRKTSSRLNLKSESSIRFERKIDYERVERALDYAAELLNELASGSVYSGVNGVVNKEIEKEVITVSLTKINSVLGTNLSDEYICDLFNRLAYTFEKNNNEYIITIPSRRMDLETSVQDIIEDVARMYGYNNIPTTIASMASVGGLTYSQKRKRLLRQTLANMGFNECVNYSLISEADLNLYTLEQNEEVKILMPLTEDRAVMRQSLLNGLVETVAYNKARKMENIAVYEMGNVYNTSEERFKLAMAISGVYTSNLWQGFKQEASFFLLKGILDSILDKFKLSVEYKPLTTLKTLHPGRSASIILNNKTIGYIGELHPKFAKEKGISGTIVLEIDLDILINQTHNLKYKSINKFPSVSRDLAIVCDKDILASDIIDTIKKTAKQSLVNASVFDVYTGPGLSYQEKSIAVAMTFEDPNKTLETMEVDKLIESILNQLKKKFNARLR